VRSPELDRIPRNESALLLKISRHLVELVGELLQFLGEFRGLHRPIFLDNCNGNIAVLP